MTIGPRVWKTGLAVTLALLVCEKLNLPSPIFAAIAAIVAMRPSVAQSIIDGGYRIIATIIGGIIGFLVLYYFGSGPFTIGFAVILAILICNGLKLQEAIVLTGITVSAVMVDVQGDPFTYAWQRLLVTLLGIVIGITVNLVFFPPRSEEALQKEIKKLNYMLKSFYIYVANGFLHSAGYESQEVEDKTEKIRLQFEEVRRKFFEFKKELGYLTSGEKIKIYEKIVSYYYLIFERIQGIYLTEWNRSNRNLDLKEVTPEYEEIIKICKQLLAATIGLQDSQTDYYFLDHDKDLYDFASSCSDESHKLIKRLRSKISQWHLADINRENNLSFLEISHIGYEMEQIYRYLNKSKDLFRKLAELEEKKSKNRVKIFF